MTVGQQPLTRDRVVDVAIELADRHGLRALSMRALGRALGVEAMSLYNHVRDKDDLLAAMADRVLSTIELPAGPDWRAATRARLLSAHAAFLAHGWVSALLLARPLPGEAARRYREATADVLRSAGFPDPLATRAWATLEAYLHGFTQQRLQIQTGGDGGSGGPREAAATDRGAVAPGAPRPGDGMPPDAGDAMLDFAFGLDLILEGLTRRKAKQQAP